MIATLITLVCLNADCTVVNRIEQQAVPVEMCLELVRSAPTVTAVGKTNVFVFCKPEGEE